MTLQCVFVLPRLWPFKLNLTLSTECLHSYKYSTPSVFPYKDIRCHSVIFWQKRKTGFLCCCKSNHKSLETQKHYEKMPLKHHFNYGFHYQISCLKHIIKLRTFKCDLSKKIHKRLSDWTSTFPGHMFINRHEWLCTKSICQFILQLNK